MKDKSTSKLLHILEHTTVEETSSFLADHADLMIDTENPFSAYYRSVIRAKGILLQDVFARADLPERYGYKLVSGEKHTKQRDYILRLCIAAGFSAKETQRALHLYGMSDLYPRVPRDAVVLIALNQGMRSIDSVNALLREHGLAPLLGSEGE